MDHQAGDTFVVDNDSTIIEGTDKDVVDDADDELVREISSATVPDPRRHSLPRHTIVDELVNALK